MVFNTTFNNISAISWRLVLLVEETGVPGENDRPVASHWLCVKDVNVSVHNLMKINLSEMEEATKNGQSRGTSNIGSKAQI
jgi:hypothetical protein